MTTFAGALETLHNSLGAKYIFVVYLSISIVSTESLADSTITFNSSLA